MQYDRFTRECKACGITCRGMTDGIPQFTGFLTGSDAEKAEAVISAHIADDAAYLATDLEQHASALKAALTEVEWAAYIKVQTDLIREKRRAEYLSDADGLFFDAQADKSSLDAWTTKREEIKAKYPWPGEYR